MYVYHLMQAECMCACICTCARIIINDSHVFCNGSIGTMCDENITCWYNNAMYSTAQSHMIWLSLNASPFVQRGTCKCMSSLVYIHVHMLHVAYTCICTSALSLIALESTSMYHCTLSGCTALRRVSSLCRECSSCVRLPLIMA